MSPSAPTPRRGFLARVAAASAALTAGSAVPRSLYRAPAAFARTGDAVGFTISP